MMSVPKLLILAILGTCASGQISEVFRDPEKACNLLEPEGFSAGELQFRPYGFECSAALDQKEGSEPRVSSAQGSISYSISGENINRVSRIKLVLQVPSEAGNKEIFDRFEELSKIVLTRLGIDVPNGLADAVKSTRYQRWLQKGGTISFDPGRRPHTSRVLAVRHPGLRVVPIPRAGTAREPH